MENTEITATKWTELLTSKSDIKTVKSFFESKMKEHYKSFEKNGTTCFILSHDTTMHICAFNEGTESCLVMSYKSSDDDDDGDQYYISDYDTPDEMFKAMLEETKS